MVVLHITTGLKNGGAEAVLYRLIMADRENRHQVISLTDQGVYGERLSAANIPVHTLEMPCGRLTYAGLKTLYRLIRRIEPDVVQTWMYHANLVGGLVARFAGRRDVVWGLHHSDLTAGRNPFSTRLVAYICAGLSGVLPRRIVACSDSAARTHIQIGYSRKKICVIPNGVDLSAFKPDPQARQETRAKLHVSTMEILLGMVGRWDPLKDHETLLKALACVREGRPTGWRCLLVGPGITLDNPDLVRLLHKYEMHDLVLLAGPQSNIAGIMNALDLHILSSSGEAFGNVTVEAMACGVPAVVTSVGAGEQIVGPTGWVAPPVNVEALAHAIDAALAEHEMPQVWMQRQGACRSRIVEKFSLERMAEAYRSVWLLCQREDSFAVSL